MGSDLKPLLGLTLKELEHVVSELELPRYAAGQIAGWLYKKEIKEITQMSNLSQNARDLLISKYSFGVSDPLQVQASTDGTRKYLFATSGGRFIETAYIPEPDRATLCVSTQVGCRMGCRFCMTATQGFEGNLSAGEILNQLRSIPERQTITNIVFMGMGEPLDNLEETLKSIEILTSAYGFGISPKRITLSTIGLMPAMNLFLDKSSCNLAISLHSPFEDQRRELLPMEKMHPFRDIIAALKSLGAEKQRRISFEYIVFKGLNHTRAHANELARVLDGIRCRINLIKFHQLPGNELQAPSDDDMQSFQQLLEKKGIITTIRRSRGQDIDAACGLLSTKKMTAKSPDKLH